MLRKHLQHLAKTPTSLRKLGLISAMILLLCIVTFSEPAVALVLCPMPASAAEEPRYCCPKGAIFSTRVVRMSNCPPPRRCRCQYRPGWFCLDGEWSRFSIIDQAEICSFL